MTTIFLSHSQADKELAHELATQIRKEFELPNEAVFVSSEPDGIPSGEWLEFVLNQLEKADIIIPLITPSSAKSMWVAFEYGHFWGRNGKAAIFPLSHPKAKIPSPLDTIQARKFTNLEELRMFFDKDLCG